jgi:hypothetical protein
VGFCQGGGTGNIDGENVGDRWCFCRNATIGILFLKVAEAAKATRLLWHAAPCLFFFIFALAQRHRSWIVLSSGHDKN